MMPATTVPACPIRNKSTRTPTSWAMSATTARRWPTIRKTTETATESGTSAIAVLRVTSTTRTPTLSPASRTIARSCPTRGSRTPMPTVWATRAIRVLSMQRTIGTRMGCARTSTTVERSSIPRRSVPSGCCPARRMMRRSVPTGGGSSSGPARLCSPSRPREDPLPGLALRCRPGDFCGISGSLLTARPWSTPPTERRSASASCTPFRLPVEWRSGSMDS